GVDLQKPAVLGGGQVLHQSQQAQGGCGHRPAELFVVQALQLVEESRAVEVELADQRFALVGKAVRRGSGDTHVVVWPCSLSNRRCSSVVSRWISRVSCVFVFSSSSCSWKS